VGVGERFGGPPVAVLDVEKMFKKMEKDGMTREEAIEYFEFNILGAHVGEENPVYLHVPEFKSASINVPLALLYSRASTIARVIGCEL